MTAYGPFAHWVANPGRFTSAADHYTAIAGIGHLHAIVSGPSPHTRTAYPELLLFATPTLSTVFRRDRLINRQSLVRRTEVAEWQWCVSLE